MVRSGSVSLLVGACTVLQRLPESKKKWVIELSTTVIVPEDVQASTATSSYAVRASDTQAGAAEGP